MSQLLNTSIHFLAKSFNDGGPFMWVILVVFAVACAVALERVLFYYVTCRNNAPRMTADVAKALNANDTALARRVTARKKAPLNQLMTVAVDRFADGSSIDDIQEAVDEAAIREMPRMTERLSYLALFANIGTLLGLLGTIVGLQLMFSSLAAVEAEKKAAMLAMGISQAMNATAFGLLVAIPSMVLYTTLHNAQAKITKELDEAMVRLLNFLKKKKAA